MKYWLTQNSLFQAKTYAESRESKIELFMQMYVQTSMESSYIKPEIHLASSAERNNRIFGLFVRNGDIRMF